LALAIIVPAVVASSINLVRVNRARQDAGTLAAFMLQQWPKGLDFAAGGPNDDGRQAAMRWVAGPGELPVALPRTPYDVVTLASFLGSIESRRLEDEEVLRPDPWQNAYLICATSGPGRAVWVLSAGPNGTIETDLELPLAAGGDDIVEVARHRSEH
jgi:hypothetical protein